MVTVRDLPKLNIGSVIELNRLASEHLDIRINDAISPTSSPIISTDKRQKKGRRFALLGTSGHLQYICSDALASPEKP